MNTFDILKKLKNCHRFSGVYPRDNLPKVTNYPFSLVINTDKSNKPGEHWVAIYFNDNKSAEYFDSFGLPPLHKEILDYILKNSTGFMYNTVTLQHPLSNACGYYVTMFLILRSSGISFCDVLSKFGRNGLKNDGKAISIIKKKQC